MEDIVFLFRHKAGPPMGVLLRMILAATPAPRSHLVNRRRACMPPRGSRIRGSKRARYERPLRVALTGRDARQMVAGAGEQRLRQTASARNDKPVRGAALAHP